MYKTFDNYKVSEKFVGKCNSEIKDYVIASQ